MKFKRILATSLALLVLFSFVSCYVSFPYPTPDGGIGGGDGADEEEGIVLPGSEILREPEKWQSSSSENLGGIPIRIFIGEPYDLSEELVDTVTAGLEWSSRCESVCTVEGGVVIGTSIGRTEIVASKDGETVARFTVTVEFMVSENSGYNIVTDMTSDDAVLISDMNEANRLLDEAVAKHLKSVTMDFSRISTEFTYKDFDLNVELGTHVSFRTAYYESAPYVIRFEITYNADAASTHTPVTEENTYYALTSANAAVRRAFMLMNTEKYTVRADDYEGFATDNEELPALDVYNSEDLWWAVEHGYRPNFAMKNSKAELFYERAKIVLREIILDGMNDYEKALAIYEYIVDSVSYDYDALALGAGKSDACYYLEGVFERGRAVCDGKSKAFVLLATMEGLVCQRDFGSSVVGDVGHAWNYVEIDGVTYIVDTTEGDAHYDATTPIFTKLGYNAESVNYASFLLPLDHHAEKYTYSGIWLTLAEGEIYPSLADEYFGIDIAEGYDFVIDTKREMNELLRALASSETACEYVLVFDLARHGATPFLYMSDADLFGFSVAIFSIAYGDGAVYLALLTRTAE